MIEQSVQGGHDRGQACRKRLLYSGFLSSNGLNDAWMTEERPLTLRDIRRKVKDPYDRFCNNSGKKEG